MLADISNVDAIYIVCGRTDMRKSIDGLCAIIQDPFSITIIGLEPHLEDKKNGAYDQLSLSDL